MQLKQILTVLMLMVPAVMSTQCQNHEFYWKPKSCCLQKGGPPNPPSPPEGSKCPKESHYWYTGKGCCAPRNPPEPGKPPKTPKCDEGWEWVPSEHKCKPCSTAPPPQTSPKPYEKKKDDKKKDKKDDKKKDKKDDEKKDKKDKYNDGKEKKKRATRTRPIHCPVGLWACPVYGLTGDYECLDIATELESCGGCTTLGQGQDCTKIEGAWNVGCERGSCKVYSCDAGYTLANDGGSCIAL